MPIQTRPQQLVPALTAGAIAIIVNTLALKAADLIPLATARGGLLRLIEPWFAPVLKVSDLSTLWQAAGLPAADTQPFQMSFHVVIGLEMALFYAWVLEPLLPGSAWVKGATYALATWILNAAIVMPATGEGFAGSADLTFGGIAWFAAAHTLFFVIMAVLYEVLAGRRIR